MHLLVGHDPDGKTANSRVSAKNCLAIFSLVFFEATIIDNASDDLFHVVRTRRVGINYAQQLLFRKSRRLRFDAAEWRTRTLAHLSDERSNSGNATLVVGLTIVHRAGNLS